jgi:hypothetical protein
MVKVNSVPGRYSVSSGETVTVIVGAPGAGRGGSSVEQLVPKPTKVRAIIIK